LRLCVFTANFRTIFRAIFAAKAQRSKDLPDGLLQSCTGRTGEAGLAISGWQSAASG
jgi:hypothetical protein